MATTIDEYIARFPDKTKQQLNDVRRAIAETLPEAIETIGYGIPVFDIGGKHVIFFAAWKDFLSVYPLPETDEKLLGKLEPFIAGKGTVRFPLDQPIPIELIKRMAIQLAHKG